MIVDPPNSTVTSALTYDPGARGLVSWLIGLRPSSDRATEVQSADKPARAGVIGQRTRHGWVRRVNYHFYTTNMCEAVCYLLESSYCIIG